MLSGCVAALLLSGCAATQPGARDRYVPAQPLLARSSEPIVRVAPETPDMRVISEHSPTPLNDHRLRPVFRHPAGDRRVQEAFFNNVPLAIAAEVLNEATGVNLVLEREVAEAQVRMTLEDVRVSDVVRALARGNGLWFRTDGSVTTLMSEAAYAQDMVFQASEKLQSFAMRYTNARDMAALLATMLAPDVTYRETSGQTVFGHLEESKSGGASSGGATDSAAAGTPGGTSTGAAADKTLATEEREQLVRLGAAQEVQPLNEAVELLGRRTPAVVTVFDRNNTLLVRTTDEGLLRHVNGIIRELDTPVRQVLLEIRIIRIELGDRFESFFDMAWDNVATLGGVAPPAADTFRAVLNSGALQARLRLFASEDRVNTLSSPFLMSSDNKEVRFFVGEQVPLRTGVSQQTFRTPELGDQIVFIPQINNQELGTELTMKSFINADGTVTMDLRAIIQTPNFGVSQIPLVNSNTGDVVQFPLDGVDRSEMNAVLAVPSGNTVVLGGFIRVENTDEERRVPFVGDVPGLRNLFRSVSRGAVRTETIILVTPYVLASPQQAAEGVEHYLDRSSQAGRQNDETLDRAERRREMQQRPLDWNPEPAAQ